MEQKKKKPRRLVHDNNQERHRHNVSIFQLRVFVETVSQGSFKMAGEILKLSHSAVFMSVKNLGEAYGATLVARKGNSVTLSVDGLDFFNAAVEILKIFDSAFENVKKI